MPAPLPYAPRTQAPRTGVGRAPAPGARAGYSLMEVLFAIGVMAIGLIAVASLFPVALLQQKRAQDDIQGGIVGRNVLALLSNVDKNTVFPVHNGPGENVNDFYPVDITSAPVAAALPAYTDYAADPGPVAQTGLAGQGFPPPVPGAASGSTLTLTYQASDADNFYKGMTVRIVSGPGVDAVTRTITNYVGKTRVATVSPSWATTPTAVSKYVVTPAPVTPATRYDYRILYRRPAADSWIEVAVLVFRPSNLNYVSYGLANTLAQRVDLNVSSGSRSIQAAFGSAQEKLAHRRNQYVLGWNTAPPLVTPQAMRVIEGDARPQPTGSVTQGAVTVAPEVNLTRLGYTADPSVSIAMGVIR